MNFFKLTKLKNKFHCDCLPVLMLLYIMLNYLILFVCIRLVYFLFHFALDFSIAVYTNAFSFHVLSLGY